VRILHRLELEAVAVPPDRPQAAVEVHNAIPLCQTRWSVTV
jgi:hypothetical protein